MLHRYHSKNGNYACLVTKIGTKYIHLVWITELGVRLKRIPKKAGRYLTVIDQTTPIAKHVRSFLDVGSRLGITKGAVKALKEVANNG